MHICTAIFQEIPLSVIRNESAGGIITGLLIPGNGIGFNLVFVAFLLIVDEKGTDARSDNYHTCEEGTYLFADHTVSNRLSV